MIVKLFTFRHYFYEWIFICLAIPCCHNSVHFCCACVRRHAGAITTIEICGIPPGERHWWTAAWPIDWRQNIWKGRGRMRLSNHSSPSKSRHGFAGMGRGEQIQHAVWWRPNCDLLYTNNWVRSWIYIFPKFLFQDHLMLPNAWMWRNKMFSSSHRPHHQVLDNLFLRSFFVDKFEFFFAKFSC